MANKSFGCLTGDQRIAQRRGLCKPCYDQLVKRVKAGGLSWEDAERQGLCKPSAKGKFENYKL